jgi:hypothetical protein
MADFSRTVIENGENEDWVNYRPQVTMKAGPDGAVFGFSRRAADAVNIYRKHKDEDTWAFAATVVDSPFIDTDYRPNIEYKVICVKGNREVGLAAFVSAD